MNAQTCQIALYDSGSTAGIYRNGIAAASFFYYCSITLFDDDVCTALTAVACVGLIIYNSAGQVAVGELQGVRPSMPPDVSCLVVPLPPGPPLSFVPLSSFAFYNGYSPVHSGSVYAAPLPASSGLLRKNEDMPHDFHWNPHITPSWKNQDQSRILLS